MGIIQITDLMGGLNSATQPTKISDNQCQVFNDLFVNYPHKIERMAGHSKYFSDDFGATPESVFSFVDNSGTTKVLVKSNGNLYSGGVSTNLGSSTSGYTDVFVTFKDSGVTKAYLTNANNGLRKTDGSSALSSVTTANNPSFVFVHNNRLFVNDPTEPNRIWYSESLLDTGLTVNYIDLRTRSDDKINGGLSFGGNIILLTRYNIIIIAGKTPSVYEQYRIETFEGCLAEKSVVSFGGEFYYLGEHGLYRCNGALSVDVSAPVKDVLDSVSFAEKAKAIATKYKDFYIITMKNIHDRYVTLFFNVKNNYFIKSSSLTPAAFGVLGGGSQQGGLLFSRHGSNFLYIFDNSNSYDGEEVDGRIQTKEFDFGDGIYTKLIQDLSVVCYGTETLKVDIVHDSGVDSYTMDLSEYSFGSSVWGTGVWGSGTWGIGRAKPIRVPIKPIRSKTFSFVLTMTGVNKQFVCGLIIDAEGEKMK